MADETKGKAQQFLEKQYEGRDYEYNFESCQRSQGNMNSDDDFPLTVNPRADIKAGKWVLYVNGTKIIENFPLTSSGFTSMCKKVDELFNATAKQIETIIANAKEVN